MSDPRFPNRPDHPDLWLISEVLIDHDTDADNGAKLEQILAPFVDLDSLVYMAGQRALRAAVHSMRVNDPVFRTAASAAVIDGFAAGADFERRRAARAEESPETFYVDEGWWAPNVKSGQVHDHKPNMPMTMHRECEPVYTKREKARS